MAAGGGLAASVFSIFGPVNHSMLGFRPSGAGLGTVGG